MDFIDVLFDGPPSHEAGRFVECEDPQRRGLSAGEWIERDDGFWALRIKPEVFADRLAEVWEESAEAHMDWVARNPGASGIPADPPVNPYEKQL